MKRKISLIAIFIASMFLLGCGNGVVVPIADDSEATAAGILRKSC